MMIKPDLGFEVKKKSKRIFPHNLHFNLSFGNGGPNF